MAQMHDPVVFISAQTKENVDELRQLLAARVEALQAQKYR